MYQERRSNGHYFVILLGVSCRLQIDRIGRSRSDFWLYAYLFSAIPTKHILAEYFAPALLD